MSKDVGTCETCGAENVLLFVYALPGVPMTVGNCKECFNLNAYPWGVIVGNTWAIGGMEEAADWWKEAVDISLGRLGKTYAELEAAVAEAEDEYRQWYEKTQVVLDENDPALD